MDPPVEGSAGGNQTVYQVDARLRCNLLRIKGVRVNALSTMSACAAGTLEHSDHR